MVLELGVVAGVQKVVVLGSPVALINQISAADRVVQQRKLMAPGVTVTK